MTIFLFNYVLYVGTNATFKSLSKPSLNFAKVRHFWKLKLLIIYSSIFTALRQKPVPVIHKQHITNTTCPNLYAKLS